MLTSELVRLYPFLFHTVADGSWPSIREHGLLSTAAMLELWAVKEAQRRDLLTTVRSESVVIEHPRLGSAVVRDQGPIHAPSLGECLTDLSVEQWLQKLNERVFFFLQRGQVDGLGGGGHAPHRSHPRTHLTPRQMYRCDGLRAPCSPTHDGRHLVQGRDR